MCECVGFAYGGVQVVNGLQRVEENCPQVLASQDPGDGYGTPTESICERVKKVRVIVRPRRHLYVSELFSHLPIARGRISYPSNEERGRGRGGILIEKKRHNS